MKGDDDEEDDANVNATRYPCMPSLVALQQMRNRLHLAHLGKKLMKWTAMATGRELRRLAFEIEETYKNFAEDMRAAFMLLARARYFYPNLNSIVLENVSNLANVTVATSTKSISGVKVLQLEVIENGISPYEHLGIEKGGQKILEAKIAWLDLLKRLIVMLQQRASFNQLEMAHKSATKKKNVLLKITIPRVKATINYIILELEEYSREELFRLKRLKQKKIKATKQKKDDQGQICPICFQKIGGKPKKEVSQIFEPKPKPLTTQLKEDRGYKKGASSAEKVAPSILYEDKDTTKKRSRSALDPFRLLTYGEDKTDFKFDTLITKLGELISLGKSFVEKNLDNINLNDLLAVCEEAKTNMEVVKQNESFKRETASDQLEDNLKYKLEHLKTHVREVINVSNEFRTEAILSPSFDNFIHTCEDVDEKLNIYMKKQESKPDTEETKSRLKELKDQIDDIVKVTKQYQKEQLLSPSVEEFVKSCELVKTKIDAREQESKNLEKLDHLKDHVKKLENLTTQVKSGGLATGSLDDFLKTCQEFKSKITQRKDKDKKPQTEDGLEKLISQIDETIELSKEARASGLVSPSVEDFITSCEDIKLQITSKQKVKSEIAKSTNVLDELEFNIDDMMQLIAKLKKDGYLTDSMEEFLKSCETTKAKVDIYKRFPEDDSDGRMLFSTCSGSCTCSMDNSLQELCDKCDQIFKEQKVSPELPAPPCDMCKGLPVEEKSADFICDSCNKPPQQAPSPPYITPEESDSEVCDVCRRYFEEQEEEEKECCKEKLKEEEPATPVDNTLGYFEKKLRKIIRVTRTQNSDGTVREEKEIITVKKEKHDPNETTLDDDDDDDFGDVSFESLIEEDDNRVVMCLAPEGNQRGFSVIKSQSENIMRISSMTSPGFRHCISADCIRYANLGDTIAGS